jgi:hypothetical protein
MANRTKRDSEVGDGEAEHQGISFSPLQKVKVSRKLVDPSRRLIDKPTR